MFGCFAKFTPIGNSKSTIKLFIPQNESSIYAWTKFYSENDQSKLLSSTFCVHFDSFFVFVDEILSGHSYVAMFFFSVYHIKLNKMRHFSVFSDTRGNIESEKVKAKTFDQSQQ